ncbi:MAG: carbohydrate ABC transporter permease [Armatimonadetes bacterium]|nr:carbohydrate ABC transporter permease [Armatimonadota bacterium]
MRRVSWFVRAALCAYSVLILFPLAWLLYTSLKSTPEIFQSAWALPKQPRWENFSHAWSGMSGEPGLGPYFANSCFITVVSVFLILAIGAMATYALTRFRFRGAGTLLNLFVSGMVFPIFLAVVPLFLLLNQTRIPGLAPKGFVDHYGGLIAVYVAYSLPFTVFVLSGFFRSLPDELAEAASLDGAGRWQTFLRVMLPLARPGLIVAGVFNVIGIWNEYPLALVLLTDRARYTLPLGLAQITQRQQYSVDFGALFAALLIVLIPTMLVYLLFQRQVSEGLMAGAVKG